MRLSIPTAATLLMFTTVPLHAAPTDEIRAHRTTEARVTVRDRQGDPVPGVRVRFKQTAHAFMLGCTLRADRFDAVVSGQDPNTAYLETIPELFNTVVFGNSMKWKYFERADWRARTDRALDWARDRGLRVRGHAMVWQTFKYGVPMPEDVERAAKAGDRAHVARRTEEHIRRVGEHYRGKLEEWDVVNEQVEEHRLTEMLSDTTEDDPTHFLTHWFRIAADADPGARLFLNDYHILVGDKTSHKDRYEHIIRGLLEAGAPLGGIGFQGHYYNGNLRRTPAQLKETLDRFAVFGLPLLVTEFDMYGNGWGGGREEREANQAAYMDTMLTTLFAHPAVTGVVFWGHWDGQHWANEAPFYRKDWTEKPALKIYREFFFNTWWTDETAETDAHGVATVRAVYGAYDLEIHHPGGILTVPVRFSPDVATADITLPNAIQLKEGTRP